jgi:hypothetical protein
MMRTIWWDIDGTIANLYAVENWLPKLRAEDPTPYAEAEVLWNMSQLARLMNQVQKLGYKLGIISWTAKNGTESYNEAVKQAKLNWLKKHLASVTWDSICVVSYGTPKSLVMETEDDILFDDEEQNRDAWLGEAYEPDMMMKVLKALLGREW